MTGGRCLGAATSCLLVLLAVSTATANTADYPTGGTAGETAAQLLGQPVTKYERMLLTVHMNRTDTAVAKKSIFFPTVDQYTRLSVAGAATDYERQPSTTLTVEANGVYSHPVPFVDSTAGYFVGAYTIEIWVNVGQVVALNWDSKLQCVDCPDTSTCLTTEHSDATFCTTEYNGTGCNDDPSQCEPRIFVVWIGTDSNNQPFTSGGLAISKFKEYSTGNLYDAIASRSDSLPS